MALPSMSVSEFDALIENCTNERIPNGELDLSGALQLSDMIRSRRIPPKEAMRCLKKRVLQTKTNQNTQFSTWRLIDVCMKNGGVPFLKEICTREFMDCLEQVILAESTDPELERFCCKLVAELYLAFKDDSQLNYVVKVYQKLIARGFEMDDIKPTENLNAMFDAKTPADWVDSDCCMICSVKFTLLNRKHHCRSCGGVFCQLHSSRFIPLPDLGIFEPVRVCDNCFDDYDLKRSSTTGKKGKRKNKSFTQATYEDDDLRKAIELSLRENGPSVDTFIPDTANVETAKAAKEETDSDLKAAIEASLREHEQEEARRKSLNQQPQQDSSASGQTMRQVEPNREITSSEEEDIHLFASLVERIKSQPPTAILEDNQLQQLYQKVLRVRPKLNYMLNETVAKYNAVYDMNGKVSDIMNMYDAMLERQLRNISISQQYAVPETTHNPNPYFPTLPQTYQKQQYTQSSNIGPTQFQTPNGLERTGNAVVYTQEANDDKVKTVDTEVESFSKPQVPPPRKTSVSSPLNDPMLSQPSEPPYPDDPPSVQKPVIMSPSERPYPGDQLEQENITTFDFPTVPLRKLSLNSNEENIHNEPMEEQLLIEL